MNFLENNKGISMVMLVITVIMMAIVLSFALFSSRNVAPEAKVATAYSSLKTVKDACENAINLTQINPKDYTEYYFFGYNVQTNNDEAFVEDIVTKCGLTSVDKISERTYLIKNSNE